MANLSIPLNSHINTADDYIITNLDTQDKTVLSKKNTLRYKNCLAPMYKRAENKVYTTSGHIIELVDNHTLKDENGRTYSVDNSLVVDKTVDITSLWSGELTSAIFKDDIIYSVWKSERDFTVVACDADKNIISSQNIEIEQTNLLYYNVKLANYTRKASKLDYTNNTPLVMVVQAVYTNPKTTIDEYSISMLDDVLAINKDYSTDYAYLTGKDLYVLRAYDNSFDTVITNIGTDDTDLRKRFIFSQQTMSLKYWGCLGSNGLVTGEPILLPYTTTGTKMSEVTFDQSGTFNFLPNGIAYTNSTGNDTSTDAAWIAANSSLGTFVTTQNGATTWGSSAVNHTRTTNKMFFVGWDLENDIPLALTPSADNTNKSQIVALEDAEILQDTVADTHCYIDQVDFSDSWGNVTWTNGVAEIANGCNPFPYKYTIMNRAESKGRYWDYGPGWARCYFRRGIIKSYEFSNKWYRGFAEEMPTSIISFGLSSATNKKNSVRIEYLDPVSKSTYSLPAGQTDAKFYESGYWLPDQAHIDKYYKYHNINDTNSHIWTNFMGADNLGARVLLGSIPFNVDIVPELNVKDQYFGLQYMSTSMEGTLMTSASLDNNSNSMIYIKDDNTAALFSNGMIMVGVRNGNIKLEKVADYIFKTNTLTGNNLFIDSTDSFSGQRGFVAYNSEEIITLDSIIGKRPAIDDTDTDGNDIYYTASGYNENMNDLQKRGVSYVLPAKTIQLAIQSSQTEDLTFQLKSNKKEITKPLIYGQFTYKDDPVDHYYTHSLDTTSIEYQTGKKLESTSTGDNYTDWFGIATYDTSKAGFVWYVTNTVYYYPLGIASLLTGINYLSSTVDMTDNYTVRLYRYKNVTFPVYNPTTEVYKGSTIFTIYGYNYSFDGQSIYYLGSGDDTAQNNFACYALGMKFLANSGTEAYFYSPFEKRLYLFTGSVTLQISDSLARYGEIVDSIYSSNEQILYLLTKEGDIIAKSQEDMCLIERVDTSYHFEGTDTGMILADGFHFIKYRLYKTDEEDWLPLEYETEYLGNNDSLYKVASVDITFFRGDYNDRIAETVSGNLYFDCMHDNMPKREKQEFKITAKDWEPTALKKIRFVPKDNVVKAFRFGIDSNDYIYIANVCVNVEEVSQNTNAPLHR